MLKKIGTGLGYAVIVLFMAGFTDLWLGHLGGYVGAAMLRVFAFLFAVVGVIFLGIARAVMGA